MQIFVKSKSGTNYPKYMPQSYSSVFGMTYDQRIHDQDDVQDLDSWQSSEDFFKESRMKQSRTMLDLSKLIDENWNWCHWYQMYASDSIGERTMLEEINQLDGRILVVMSKSRMNHWLTVAKFKITERITGTIMKKIGLLDLEFNQLSLQLQ